MNLNQKGYLVIHKDELARDVVGTFSCHCDSYDSARILQITRFKNPEEYVIISYELVIGSQNSLPKTK